MQVRWSCTVLQVVLLASPPPRAKIMRAILWVPGWDRGCGFLSPKPGASGCAQQRKGSWLSLLDKANTRAEAANQSEVSFSTGKLVVGESAILAPKLRLRSNGGWLACSRPRRPLKYQARTISLRLAEPDSPGYVNEVHSPAVSVHRRKFFGLCFEASSDGALSPRITQIIDDPYLRRIQVP